MQNEMSFESFIDLYIEALKAASKEDWTQVIAFNKADGLFDFGPWHSGPPEYNWLMVSPSLRDPSSAGAAAGSNAGEVKDELRDRLLNDEELKRWHEQALLDPVPAIELAPAFAEAVASAVIQFSDPKRQPPEFEDDDGIAVGFDFPTASFFTVEGRDFPLRSFAVDREWLEEFDLFDLHKIADQPEKFRQAIVEKVRQLPNLLHIIEGVRRGQE